MPGAALQRPGRSSESKPMRRRLPALFCLALLAPSLSGCWVVEELDKGKKLMDDHSPKPKAEKEAPVAKQVGGALDGYFGAEEKEGTTKTFAPGQVSEGIVGCKLGGKLQFMKREECAARGGRAR
jgi:hypothetical protein